MDKNDTFQQNKTDKLQDLPSKSRYIIPTQNEIIHTGLSRSEWPEEESKYTWVTIINLLNKALYCYLHHKP